MDQSKIGRLRCALSAHLTLLALLTTIVVSTGSGSVFMPCLILLIGVFSFIFVDWLDWFTLHRSLAYLGMVVGTFSALADYCWGVLYADSPTHQLYAVASLLVYPQAVLLLQRKNVRIFEQIAIFLLLEVVVASLVNDSLLFGLLLAPIVLLWVSSLFLLARYSAIIKLDPSMEIATPRLVELVGAYLWRRHFGSNGKKPPSASVSIFTMRSMQEPGFGKLIAQTLPIALATSVFACLYFALLPRLEGINYSIPQPSGPRTGFSRSLTLGMTGKMLQDRTPALRLKLTHLRTGKLYTLYEPPYIRGIVYGDYGKSANSYSGEYSWQPLRVDPAHGKLPELSSLSKTYTENRDVVRTRFEILGDPTTFFTVAPMFMSGKKKEEITFLPFDWRVVRTENYSQFSNVRSSYEFGSLGFFGGTNVPLIPFDDCDFSLHKGDYLDKEKERTLDQLGTLCHMTNSGSVHEDEQSFQSLIALKDRILHDAGVTLSKPVDVARTLRDYFAKSGEFTYSLELEMQRDLLLNPVEDFIANQRKGHCQYFASALALMLRHCGIPARIVAGFHPNEFNQLGKYFVIRNSDAHVWVEAFFTAAELEDSGMRFGQSGPYDGWLTLDPTPAGEGSNAGSELHEQPDQAIDYAQQLWSDYIIEANHLSSENSFYAIVAAGFSEAYNAIIAQSLVILDEIHRGVLLNRIASQEYWFSWPMALLVAVLGGGILCLWRLVVWLPNIAWRLAAKLGLSNQSFAISQQFFVRCLKLLSTINFRRAPSQTPRELTESAANFLMSRSCPVAADEPLAVLTATYYKMRFSDRTQLSKHELQVVEQALDALQHAVKNR